MHGPVNAKHVLILFLRLSPGRRGSFQIFRLKSCTQFVSPICVDLVLIDLINLTILSSLKVASRE